MLKPVLNDKNKYPNTKILTMHLGKSTNAWNAFIDLLKSAYPLISTEWGYYIDGKSWLFKVTKKTKTICWVSVWNRYFKVTFYFNNKAEEILKKSLLDKRLKKHWLKDKENGNTRPITIEVKSKTDLKTVKILIDLNESIK